MYRRIKEKIQPLVADNTVGSLSSAIKVLNDCADIAYETHNLLLLEEISSIQAKLVNVKSSLENLIKE